MASNSNNQAVSLCQQLVRIDSVTGREKAVADFIVSFCKKHKLAYKRLQDSVVILPANQKPRDTAIIFYAHIDTVPAGEEKAWRHPPFSAKISGGKLYGLGASDDKAAAACLLQTAVELKDTSTSSDIYYLFAQGEERDGIGAQNFTQWFSSSGRKARYKHTWAIIGEPTDLKNIELGCRGSMFVRFNIHGKSYHGADPLRQDDDALSKALRVAPLIASLQANAQKRYTHSALGKPTIALTGLQAGVRANQLPDLARLTLDIRTTPGFHAKAISSINAVLRRAGLRPTLEVSVRCLPPYLTPATSSFARQMAKFTGAKTGVSRGSNDCAFFIAAGIPALSYGPGVKACIHQHNEYVPLAHLSRACLQYKKLAQNLKPS